MLKIKFITYLFYLPIIFLCINGCEPEDFNNDIKRYVGSWVLSSSSKYYDSVFVNKSLIEIKDDFSFNSNYSFFFNDSVDKNKPIYGKWMLGRSYKKPPFSADQELDYRYIELTVDSVTVRWITTGEGRNDGNMTWSDVKERKIIYVWELH